ncbi:MAG: hypothetical protein HYZ28_10465 [Myxococcales bacterium]|nr:hypothetical protein [Myxococcales bacterium]
MKPRRLSEVRALISQADFQDWWAQLVQTRQDENNALERYDELLSQVTLTEFRAELTQKNAIDTLYRAGECEDSAAQKLFEATELENRSFRALADFEEQRYKVSELWYRLGAADKDLDEKREQHDKLKSKKTEAELKLAERVFRAASDEYERETGRKNRLWDEVERIWANSAEVSLLVAEQRVRGRKIRKQAEALFASADEKKLRARELRAEAETASATVDGAHAKIKQLFEQARVSFGCAPGDDFLYFRQKESQKLAFAVALVEDAENYNVEVKPLSIYTVERQRGASFLEPARAEASAAEEGDRRFEEYFLKGRKGEARSSESAG